ncbi:uncharacterized protein HGUI_03677 [Hanseniaspora guilliermondii]|uniref:TFIIS N-terminal domain-containing protein n=1 Tax=Hanseniaspora guilliermondii TaxID=56406 RepID=A0A1L0B6L5_9ASCO|nr:uncharacterized protein HGUI_03677 [Hanseniaspora guilliermondii]
MSDIESDKLQRRQAISDKLDETIKELNTKKGGSRKSKKDSIDIDAYTSIDSKIQRLKDEMIQAAKRDNEIILAQIEGKEFKEDTTNKDDEDKDFDLSDEEKDEEAVESEDVEKQDVEKSNVKTIAASKLVLLPKVLHILNRVDLHESLLENNILLAIRFWLDPLPDGSLPSYEIQKNLINILIDLNIANKNENGSFTKYLKESGIGKLLIFYKKSKRVEVNLKRKVEKLLSDWSRPIIQASDNYKHKRILKKEYDYKQHQIEQTKKLKQNLKKTKEENETRKKIKTAQVNKSQLESERKMREEGRTVIPVSSVRDYKYAPVADLEQLKNHTSDLAGVGSTLGKNELFKRINRKMGKK